MKFIIAFGVSVQTDKILVSPYNIVCCEGLSVVEGYALTDFECVGKFVF